MSIPEQVPFIFIPFVTIDKLDEKQRNYYEFWKQQYNLGIFEDIQGNLTYLFVYMHEFIANHNYSENISELLKMKNEYGDYKKIEEYCNLWIKDSYIGLEKYDKALDYAPNDLTLLKINGCFPSFEQLVLKIYPQNFTSVGKRLTKHLETELILIAREFEREKNLDLIKECIEIDDHYRIYSANPLYYKIVKLDTLYFDHNKFWRFFPEDICYIAENRVREKLNLPKIGEQWVSETILYYEIKSVFSKYNVTQHQNLDFLGKQHLDIYIHELKIGIEYQGEQHNQPVSLFGGEKGFERIQERDRRKQHLCKKNNVFLVYVYPQYNLTRIINEIIYKAKKSGKIVSDLTLDVDLDALTEKILNSSFNNMPENFDEIFEDVEDWKTSQIKRRHYNHNKKEIDNTINHLLEGLEKSKFALDKHNYLSHLSYWYYRYREYPNFIDECLYYSILDIDLFPHCLSDFDDGNFDRLISGFKTELGNNPLPIEKKKENIIISFVNVLKRLTFIYTNLGDYEAAIKFYDKSEIINLADIKTQKLFAKRKEKLIFLISNYG